MKITLIAEGSTPEDRKREHWGISFLVGDDMVFDTFGKSDVFMHNLQCHADAAQIRTVVISHDDWDHVVGLDALVVVSRGITLHLCPHTDAKIVAKATAAGAHIISSTEPHEVMPAIETTGEFRAESDGRIIYEQSLCVRSSKGIALLTGCAHPGIVNLVAYVKRRYGAYPYCVIGGFHLKNMAPHAYEEIVTTLKGMRITQLCPLHCTGAAPVQYMKKLVGTACISLRVGDTIEV